MIVVVILIIRSYNNVLKHNIVNLIIIFKIFENFHRGLHRLESPQVQPTKFVLKHIIKIPPISKLGTYKTQIVY